MSDAKSRNPFTGRGFVLGAIFIGSLAAVALVLTITSPNSGSAESLPASPAPVVSAIATADPATASVCGLAGYDTTNTLTAIPETKWEIVGTMAAPSSKTAGPGVTGTDGVRSCYAHTAAGAVFAVANLWAMGTDVRLAPLVISQMTVPGPGRDAAMAMAMKTTQGNTGTSAQVAGYKILSYDGTDATVDVVLGLGTGELFSFPVPVKWSGGDWKTVVTDDGQQVFRPTALQSLGGYTPWAGLK